MTHSYPGVTAKGVTVMTGPITLSSPNISSNIVTLYSKNVLSRVVSWGKNSFLESRRSNENENKLLIGKNKLYFEGFHTIHLQRNEIYNIWIMELMYVVVMLLLLLLLSIALLYILISKCFRFSISTVKL